jgi:hypothetical protein
MTTANVRIVADSPEEENVYAEDFDSVTVEFPEDESSHVCSACGTAGVEYADGIEPEDSSETHCPDSECEECDCVGMVDEARNDVNVLVDCPAGCDSGRGPHDWQRRILSFVNSAGIDVKEDDDSVTVSISVGDPRGAFTMTVRRIPESADGELAGKLILHVPHGSMPMSHMPLKELHDGTYVIG